MKEYDRVRTLVDRKENWSDAIIPAGKVGTIVMAFGNGEAFEVEFGNNNWLGDYAPDEIEVCVKRRLKSS